jgi:hypothetical protein
MTESAAITKEMRAAFLPIMIPKSDTEDYRIISYDFPRDKLADDDQLTTLTHQILKVFRLVERDVNRAVQEGKSSTEALTLDGELAKKHLVDLAMYGKTVYDRLFNKAAQEELAAYLDPSSFTAPTFISEVIPFPWEVLYEGQDFRDGDAEMFWGIRYAPARILQPDRSLKKHSLEQLPPSDMLFCLHHRLKYAKSQEWQEVQKLLGQATDSRFQLLADSMCAEAAAAEDGDRLLEYLDRAEHNMLHFACHCRPAEAGADALLISALKDDQAISEDERTLTLETSRIELIPGRFNRQPLIFLNACQSGPSPDDVGKTYNLPVMFMKRGAGAVIATACPVPDVFAAEFARVFYTEFLRPQKLVGGARQDVLKSRMIGEALQRTRRYFLTKYNNPLGLAYGLYSPAFYRLPEPKEQTEL